MKHTFLNGRIVIEEAALQSDLERLTCEFCGHPSCCHSCDESQEGQEPEIPVVDRIRYNGMIDALESLVLSLTLVGVITNEDPKANEAIQTTLDAIENSVEI